MSRHHTQPVRRQHPAGPAIAASGLVKVYPGGRGRPPVQALDGLTIDVPAGTVFGLLGPNGAGKSTTVKILTTLARADSGSAQVAGVDVARDPAAVRRSVGLVGQKPSTDPMGTGRENLRLAARIHGLRGGALTRRVDELLERFALGDAADRLVRTYSGGMARKLDVALGLVHRPPVLFLDEPTTGLDPQARAEMWAEIARMADDEEVTVLLTTHYLDEADRLAHRVAIVDHGTVVVEGTPDDLKSRLRGDTVHVTLADSASTGRAAAVLRRVEGLGSVTVAGDTVHARTEVGGRVVVRVMSALESEGVEAAAVTVARPSLDEVYLRYAGRRFGEVA